MLFLLKPKVENSCCYLLLIASSLNNTQGREHPILAIISNHL
ncbi:MAG: hypothetical protein OFPII_32440 [Osedax symbiont Rs1]|nr:MAG: hypothetical protein OFPII_32440 [Osedax symbiont Rs1]